MINIMIAVRCVLPRGAIYTQSHFMIHVMDMPLIYSCIQLPLSPSFTKPFSLLIPPVHKQQLQQRIRRLASPHILQPISL